MSEIAPWQEFKLSCDTCEIHKDEVMRLFKQYFIGAAEAAVNTRSTLSIIANFCHDARLKSYPAIFQFLLKRFVIYDCRAMLDAEVCNLRQKSMYRTEFAQELWTKTLRCVSIYDESFVKSLFVEAVPS